MSTVEAKPTPLWRISVSPRRSELDAHGAAVLRDTRELGIGQDSPDVLDLFRKPSKEHERDSPGDRRHTKGDADVPPHGRAPGKVNHDGIRWILFHPLEQRAGIHSLPLDLISQIRHR